MKEFYTVPEAITFRNIEKLGKEQTRTLLLQNKSEKDVPVFLSQPFTENFSLVCHSINQQQQTAPACIVTRVPAAGSCKVVLKLNPPSNLDETDNFHDCLVMVMGKEPLLVPIRAVKRQLDPTSGQGLEAILAQLDFNPPQHELDGHCDAFVVELASQLHLDLQPPSFSSTTGGDQAPDVGTGEHLSLSSGQQQQTEQEQTQHRHLQLLQHSQPYQQQTQQELQHRPQRPCLGMSGTEGPLQPFLRSSSITGHASDWHGLGLNPPQDLEATASQGTGSCLPPDTFSQAPAPASSSSSSSDGIEHPTNSRTPHSKPCVPQLLHTITIQGRTAFATRVSRSSTSSPQKQQSQTHAPCTGALTGQLPSPTSPPDAASTGTSFNNSSKCMPSNLTEPPHAGPDECTQNSADFSQGQQQQNLLKSSSNSGNSAVNNDCNLGSLGNTGIRLTGAGSGSTGPVFWLSGRCYNARGEEVAMPGNAGQLACQEGAPKLGSQLLSLQCRQASDQRSAALVAAMHDLGVHDLPPPSAHLAASSTTNLFSTLTSTKSQTKEPPSKTSSHQGSQQETLTGGCLAQLELPPKSFSRTPIYGSSSSFVSQACSGNQSTRPPALHASTGRGGMVMRSGPHNGGANMGALRRNSVGAEGASALRSGIGSNACAGRAGATMQGFGSSGGCGTARGGSSALTPGCVRSSGAGRGLTGLQRSSSTGKPQSTLHKPLAATRAASSGPATGAPTQEALGRPAAAAAAAAADLPAASESKPVVARITTSAGNPAVAPTGAAKQALAKPAAAKRPGAANPTATKPAAPKQTTELPSTGARGKVTVGRSKAGQGHDRSSSNAELSGSGDEGDVCGLEALLEAHIAQGSMAASTTLNSTRPVKAGRTDEREAQLGSANGSVSVVENSTSIRGRQAERSGSDDDDDDGEEFAEELARAVERHIGAEAGGGVQARTSKADVSNKQHPVRLVPPGLHLAAAASIKQARNAY